MKKTKILATAALVGLLFTFSATTVVFAGEDGEGYSEESSGFSEESSSDESNDSSEPSEPSSEPDSPSEPAPAPSEPDSPSEPAPAPSEPDSPSEPAVVPSEPTDSGSSDSGSSDPIVAPFVVPVVTPTVETPVVVTTEQPATTPEKKVARVVTPAVEAKEVVLPYEPPYFTPAPEPEEEEEEVMPVIDSGVISERQAPAEEPRKSFPWALLGAIAALLLAILAFYRPYKVVKVAKEEQGDEKSFYSVKKAAKYAAELLDSKDFEATFEGLEVVRKKDDKNDQAEKIDRIIFTCNANGTDKKVIKATDKEREALANARLIGIEVEGLESMSAEEAASQWEELAAEMMA